MDICSSYACVTYTLHIPKYFFYNFCLSVPANHWHDWTNFDETFTGWCNKEWQANFILEISLIFITRSKSRTQLLFICKISLCSYIYWFIRYFCQSTMKFNKFVLKSMLLIFLNHMTATKQITFLTEKKNVACRH